MENHSSPYISIIVPLYNKEVIIERTIKSVLTQSYLNFELIVVDDGSTDRSLAIVEGIQDDRIKIIKQKNGGPGSARNTGVARSKGDWIVFLDADDELLPDTLIYFVSLTYQHPNIDIFDCGRCLQCGSSRIILSHSDIGQIDNNFKAWFYKEISPGAGPSLFRKDFVLEHPYREDIRRYEDAELLFRILRTAKVYATNILVEIHNVDYIEASHVRSNISDDFVGHLSFKGLTFWQIMCMYRLYLMERDNYPIDMHRLYPTLRYRYDLLLIYKILNMRLAF